MIIAFLCDLMLQTEQVPFYGRVASLMSHLGSELVAAGSFFGGPYRRNHFYLNDLRSRSPPELGAG